MWRTNESWESEQCERESKIYSMNEKWSEEGGMEYAKGSMKYQI